MKTTKTTKILIALDYNPTAQRVAEIGFSLAKTMNAEVTLLHVIVDPIFYSSPDNFPILGFFGTTPTTSLPTNSADELQKASLHFLEKIKHHLDDDTIKMMVKDGDFADSILKTAAEIHADVIVMGSHSQKWLENIVMGSVTEAVLRQTTIPLFIIPTKKRHGNTP
jgi:nucleotide-binding universal stress UspA family protein